MWVRMGVVRCAGGGMVVIVATGRVPSGITAVVRVLHRRLPGLSAAIVIHIEAASLEHDRGHGDALLPLTAALRARRLSSVVIPLPHCEAV